jgi:hypothetical protein
MVLLGVGDAENDLAGPLEGTGVLVRPEAIG